MSYGNMDEEIKKHQAFIKQSETTLSKLSTFVKDIGKTGVKFIEKIQKSFDEFISELKKEDNTTTMNLALTNICNEFSLYFNKKKESFISIDKKLGDKISEFEKDYKNKYRENISKINKLSTKINDSKFQLDKIKNEYFNSCKEIIEIEKKIQKKMSGDELEKMIDKKIKIKQISETKKSSYYKEVTNFNKLLDDNETEYLGIKASFKNDHNDKILFYIEILNLINNICKFQNENLLNTLKKMNKSKEDINIRRDLKLYEQDFNFLNNATKKRFVEEQFLNYELRNRSGSKNKYENKGNDEQNLEDEDSKYMKALQILELGKDDFIDNSTLNENDIKLDKIITDLIEGEKKIEDNEFITLAEFYKSNINNSKRFIYLLVNHFCVRNFIQIPSLENFQYLNDILCKIFESCLKDEDTYELVFLIMFIANKTIYYNSKTNTIEHYLCYDMAKTKSNIFSDMNFWVKLLKERVELIAQVEITQEMQKRKDSIGKEDNTLIDSAINKFGKFFGFGGNNKNLEKEILFNQLFQKNQAKLCDKVLNDYSKHFRNFNLKGDIIDKLIDQLGITYSLPNEYKDFFKKVSKTNEEIKKTIKNKRFLDENNLDKYYFTYKGDKKFKGIEDPKIISLIFSLKFIDIKDIPKILSLNKDVNKKLSKIIYKNILFKYFDKIDTKTHISIWKILLNYSEIKKKYDYKKILEEVKKSPDSVKNIDIIQLDVIRTSFYSEEEEKREKISNMLKAISKELPSLNYCQGMNQIASFLLDVCDYNEEEAFYVFLSLMIDSVYSNLFKNELEKLNIIFYQFERILSQIFPEIYSYLIENKITPGFFISPWFITLFTDTFIDNPEKNNKKIIMKIFDMFIFGGWKAIIKIGLSLLKYNDIKILKTPMEELLNYLTNDVIKCKFFEKGNLTDVLKASIEYKIKKQILDDTNEQYKIKKSLPSLG
jgi:hypothetical protein